jgi:hypothetical protein
MDGRMEKPLATGDDGARAGLDRWGSCDERRSRQQRGGKEGGEHGDDVVWLSDGRDLRSGMCDDDVDDARGDTPTF